MDPFAPPDAGGESEFPLPAYEAPPDQPPPGSPAPEAQETGEVLPGDIFSMPPAPESQPPVYTSAPRPDTTAQAQKPQASFPVNVNTASQAALETLPGIGPVKARAIIDYRNANGAFHSPGDLIKVTGIGEKTLENLLPYVTV